MSHVPPDALWRGEGPVFLFFLSSSFTFSAADFVVGWFVVGRFYPMKGLIPSPELANRKKTWQLRVQ